MRCDNKNLDTKARSTERPMQFTSIRNGFLLSQIDVVHSDPGLRSLRALTVAKLMVFGICDQLESRLLILASENS